MLRLLSCLLTAVIAVLATTSSAHAIAYVQGNHPIELLDGPCLPESALVMYTQQSAGEHPIVGETFWVGAKVRFDESFDCAAEFWAAELTLPNSLAPAISAGSAPICIRTGVNGQGTVFTDPRAASNCPTALGATGLTWNPTSRKLRIGPKPSASFPDVGDPTSRFFLGQASGESIEYKEMVVWVPVKATAAFTAQPMTALVCTNGMGCSSRFGGTTDVFVNMTVSSSAPTAVELNVNPDVWVSATGMNLQYFLTFAGGGTRNIRHHLWYDNGGGNQYICGSPTATSFTDAALPSNGVGQSHLFVFGDFEQYPPVSTPEANRCYLPPDTAHTVRICDTLPEPDQCREIGFRTSAVVTDFETPGEDTTDMPLSSSLVVRGRAVRGAHPAGTAYLRFRPTSGGSWSTTTSTAVTKSDAAGPVSLPDRVLSISAPWRRYELESCFNYTGMFTRLMCSPTSQVTAGYMSTPSDATDVTHSTATASGLPTPPWPAGTMTIRARTGASGAGDPAGSGFSQIGAAAVPEWPSTAAGTPTRIALSGLAASTTYHWAACFDVPDTAGIEDCSAVRTFTTNAAPAGGGGTGGGTTAPPTTPRNTIKPRIIGVTRVGKVLTCSRGTWTPGSGVTFTYRWKRASAFIPRATTRTRRLVQADRGKRITCVVTARIGARSASASSRATLPIRPRA